MTHIVYDVIGYMYVIIQLNRRTVTHLDAIQFAGCTALAGSIILFNLNSTAGLLGILNLFIYSWMPSISYTASKRKTVWNTQWGAVVGLIPPLIGMSYYESYM